MGLRIGDLKDCVDHIFEIDSFKSKMGDDKDIVTLSFSVNEANAADDLMNFIEKGYEFVLDADVTSGEQSDGTYKGFVELERNSYLESIDMRNDQLRLKKAYAEPLVFEFKDFGERQEVLNRLDEKINVNEFAEVIYLCKYVGDYNITKYGDKLMFENSDTALVLKRLN